MKQSKFVFEFGTKTDGNASMRELLGGKGANLAEMASIGLPVPPGFTISTEVCTYFYEHDRKYPQNTCYRCEKGNRIGGISAKQKLRSEEKSSAGFGPIWRQRFHAGHDGYHS
ncbi:MAG: PEP/pyruvate-binding domain-containing protein [Pseudohongiellaceae bacterium]